jgi:hypothetical protein
VTLLLAVGFALAAGFSSRVGRGNEVLLVPQGCSYPVGFGLSSYDDIWETWFAQLQMEVTGYAQSCYSDNSTGVGSCGNSLFFQDRLSLEVNSNATCPFDADLVVSNTSNLILDTGLIDTNDRLGVNAPPDQRLQHRIVLQCAPLSITGYSPNYQAVNNFTYTRYEYSAGNDASHNFTYEYPSMTSDVWYTSGDQDSDWWQSEYKLEWASAWPSLF